MGDMGDVFNAMREDDKVRRHNNLEKAEAIDFDDFTKHTQWHWSRLLEDKRLDYWPTKNKWKYDKMYFGTAQDLRNFVDKRIAGGWKS